MTWLTEKPVAPAGWYWRLLIKSPGLPWKKPEPFWIRGYKTVSSADKRYVYLWWHEPIAEPAAPGKGEEDGG